MKAREEKRKRVEKKTGGEKQERRLFAELCVVISQKETQYKMLQGV